VLVLALVVVMVLVAAFLVNAMDCFRSDRSNCSMTPSFGFWIWKILGSLLITGIIVALTFLRMSHETQEVTVGSVR
jgi:uncharacterized BrkB/YihY/UPF0761 family membrane protein